jgi:hypothetical protein
MPTGVCEWLPLGVGDVHEGAHAPGDCSRNCCMKTSLVIIARSAGAPRRVLPARNSSFMDACLDFMLETDVRPSATPSWTKSSTKTGNWFCRRKEGA